MMRRLALCLAFAIAPMALTGCADIPVDAPVDVKVPIKVDAPVNITIHCERCTVLPEGFTLGGSDTGLLLGGVIRGLMNPPKPDADPAGRSKSPDAVPTPDVQPSAPATPYIPGARLPDLGWWPFGKRQEN